MSFSQEQKDWLAAPLSRDNVKVRQQSGRSLSYIEGWVAIKEANRIFGFDGWSRETITLQCVSEKEREVGAQKLPGWGVTYTAKVRITVGEIVREGCGTGHGIDRDLGQAHESALKEAETDAMKRCLMTFGNPFGLALYDKEQAGVEDAPKQSSKAPEKPHKDGHDGQMQDWVDRQIEFLDGAQSLSELTEWLDKNAGLPAKGDKPARTGDLSNPAASSNLARLRDASPNHYAVIKARYLQRLAML